MLFQTPSGERRLTGHIGKVAIVTGAGGGQGRAHVEALLAAGFRVMATDIDDGGRDADARHDQRVCRLSQDVASPAGWQTVVQSTLDAFGGIDALVNNAAIFQPGGLQGTTIEAFENHYRVNQLGVFLGMSSVIGPMSARGGGAIINIASVGGLRGFAGEFAYCTSKWAVRGMSRCAALDLAPLGIRVNAIFPGPIDTPMLAASAGDIDWSAATPLGRLGQPEDVAGLVVFLAGDQSRYITGAEIAVDGGLVA